MLPKYHASADVGISSELERGYNYRFWGFNFKIASPHPVAARELVSCVGPITTCVARSLDWPGHLLLARTLIVSRVTPSGDRFGRFLLRKRYDRTSNDDSEYRETGQEGRIMHDEEA